jgi:hypothetical protein
MVVEDIAQERPRRAVGERPSPSRSRPAIWIVLALLAGLLIISHGCHSDEDTELFSRGWWTSF